MSIVYIDSFDVWGPSDELNDLWAIASGGIVMQTSSGRFGGGAAQVDGLDDGMYMSMSTTEDYLTVGAAIKVTSYSLNQLPLMAWSADTGVPDALTTCNISAVVNNDGSISLRNSTTELGSTSSGLIAIDAWNYIELQVFRNETTGAANLCVNGNIELAVSNVDTQFATATSFVTFISFDTSSGSYLVDDVYIAQDASSMPPIYGDVKMEALLPNADTAVTDWVRNAGTNDYQAIDDPLNANADDDTTYISASALNSVSEFDVADMSAGSLQIMAVAVTTKSKKTDAGSISYTPYIDSSGVEEFGTEIFPSETGYLYDQDVYLTDPNTGYEWDEAGVNALKIGFKITS